MDTDGWAISGLLNNLALDNENRQGPDGDLMVCDGIQSAVRQSFVGREPRVDRDLL